MWILTGASDICSCWMSVFTAMNSTPVTPAAIIRLSALQPPPPTPATRITARYGFAPERGGAVSAPSPMSTTRGRAGSGRSPWADCCAAAPSVALNSWASGPSRMLWRRFAIAEHLPRQVAVRLGGVPLGIVLEYGGAFHGRLRVADRLADARVEHQLAEVLLQDLDRLAGVQRAAVEHRRQDAGDVHVRVQVVPDHGQGVLELDQPTQAQVLALHGD